MGFFSTLAIAYILFAFAFQIGSIAFIAFDEKCSHRLAWSAVTFITGPVGVVAYAFKGRK